MAEIIHIKCNLCSDAHEYIFENKQISALNAEWKALVQQEGLLNSIPVIDESYEVVLGGLLKIDLSQPFWVAYMNPYSTYNGLEDEEGIKSIRFCLCEHEVVLAKDERSACLKVKVLDVYDLQKHAGFMNPKKIGWFVLIKSDHRYRYEESFHDHYFIRINVESDQGLTLIIKKEQDRSYIVAVNEWDFHRDIWHLYYEELTPDKKQEYGITNL